MNGYKGVLLIDVRVTIFRRPLQEDGTSCCYCWPHVWSHDCPTPCQCNEPIRFTGYCRCFDLFYWTWFSLLLSTLSYHHGNNIQTTPLLTINNPHRAIPVSCPDHTIVSTILLYVLRVGVVSPPPAAETCLTYESLTSHTPTQRRRYHGIKWVNYSSQLPL